MNQIDNHISARRIFRLFVFAFLGIATLLLPAYLSGALGAFAGIAILFGGIGGVVYLYYLMRCRKKLNTDLFTVLHRRLPRPAGWAVSVIAALFHAACAGYLAAVTADMVKQNLIREETYVLIVFLLCCAAAYTAQKSAKDSAQVCEILFLFVLIPLIVMLLLAAKDIDLLYDIPHNMPETRNIVSVSYAVFCCFGSLFFVLYIPGRGGIAEKKLACCVRRALYAAMLLLLFLYYVLVGAFGERALSVLSYPVITLMSMIRFRGGFWKRLDAVMLAVWFFSLFALLVMHLYCARRLLAPRRSAAKIKRLPVIFLYVLVFCEALWIGEEEEMLQLLRKFFLFVQIPLQLVFPGVLAFFCGGRFSRKKKKRAPKKTLGAMALALVCQSLGGCASVELEEKIFPLYAGVQSDGSSYTVLYEPYAEEKKIDVSHLKVIVFEEEFLKNEEGYEAFLSGVLTEDTYPRNAYVAVTKDVSLFSGIRESTGKELGEYLEDFLETRSGEAKKSLPTIGALSDDLLNRQKTLDLPYLTADGDAVTWENDYRIEKSRPVGVLSTANAARLQRQIASKILRFHVLANSDSEEDQAVKLKVRDAVGAQIEALLSDADSLSDCKKIVSDNLEDICRIAEETLRDEGVSYGATGEVCVTDFPEKTYGSFTFPAGEYEALCIVLGDGEGQNWWCVLYPNLCFRGSVYEVDEESEDVLKSVLSEEEYRSVFRSGRFRIRLRFLEKIKGTKSSP